MMGAVDRNGVAGDVVAPSDCNSNTSAEFLDLAVTAHRHLVSLVAPTELSLVGFGICQAYSVGNGPGATALTECRAHSTRQRHGSSH